MPWLTVFLVASATATLMVGGGQFRLWMADRDRSERLLFAVASVGAAATALLEVRLIHASTPREFNEILQWMHVPGGLAVVAIAWFTVVYLRPRSAFVFSIAWVFTLIRVALMAANFAGPGNATYAEVSALRPVELLGETVVIATGVESPWRTLTQLGNLSLLVLIVGATVSAHRGRTRERPWVVGGVLFATILLFGALSQAAARGLLPGPTASVGFVVFLLFTSVELGRELARSVESSRALATAARRLARAADAAQITLWEWNPGTGALWTYASGSSRDAGGGYTSLDTFLGTVNEADRDRLRASISHTMSVGGQLEEEYRVVEPGGQDRWWSIAGAVDSGPGPDDRVLRGAARDITERKAVEQALETQRNALARADRAMTLAHLSAGLAHELRQPLGAMLRDVDTVEMLNARSGSESTELPAVIADLRASVARADEVITRLHDFSAARPPSFAPVDLTSLVQQTLALVRAEALRQGIALEVNLEPDLAPVQGDPIQIQQVLVNLLLNAFEAVRGAATDPPRVSLWVRSDGAGRQVVEVSDSGPGISDPVAERVFDPFYTTKPEGSGIGLWISRSIVEGHGGQLELACRTPGATTFRVLLDSNGVAAHG